MFFQKQLKRGIEMNIAYHNTVVYISQELNYNIATTSFMSRGLDNLQATKLRVCTLVLFSAGGRKQ